MDEPKVVAEVRADAHWFSVLYMRWTVTYWVLTLLAAGTAITTALKSTNSQQIDAHLIMWLAVGTVIATVLQGAIRPDKLAQKYRAGDLFMQDALKDYEASSKSDADIKALVAANKQANKFLGDSL